MPVNRSMVCKFTVFSEHFPACAATPEMFTWGAPGTESVPGSWVWVPQVRFSTWVLGLGVPGSIFYLGLGFGCPRFDFLPGSWVWVSQVRFSTWVLGLPFPALSFRPERPDFILRAVFWRVGPRSGGTVFHRTFFVR